jgi:hypothetical protein
VGKPFTRRSGTGRVSINIMSEVYGMLLSEAQKYLEIVRKRGEEKGNLKRVYSNITKHRGLFYMAYNNL